MLSRICNKLYPTFINSLEIFSQFDRFIYDSTQYKKHGKHPYSFLGEFLCGESCFILKYLLEKEGYNVKVYKNHTGYGKNLKDHVFLYVDSSNIIVDPTYRQFIVNSADRKKLFIETPPILVTKNLKKSVGNLVGIDEYRKVRKNWRFMEDVSCKFNLGEFVRNEKMLIGKPSYYKKLVKSL